MRLTICFAVTLLIAGCGDENPAEPTHQDSQKSVMPDATAVSVTNGQAIYVQSCLLCHQHDGGGVPDMQPPLVDSAIAGGDADVLIDLVLRGIGGKPPSLPASGKYAMVMPGVPQLTDQQIADLLTYIRQEYVQAGPISPVEVAAVRAKLE